MQIYSKTACDIDAASEGQSNSKVISAHRNISFHGCVKSLEVNFACIYLVTWISGYDDNLSKLINC